MMYPPLLSAQNLTRTLEGDIPVTLVKDISLTIQPEQFTAITGPSGSGKSSLLYILGLLDHPTSGVLKIDDTQTQTLGENALAALRLEKLGFIFQFHFLLPEFSALENVRLPMQRLGKISDKEQIEKAENLLAGMGLADHRHKTPKQMSGGQCQRVAIARALANDPMLIMADEPTGNLDSVSSHTVQDILIGIAHQKGRAVVTVTHDLEFAQKADQRIHLIDGKIAAL